MNTTTNTTESRIYNLIILDESGSMDHIRMQALSGANETLQTIRMAQKENPADNHMVSFVTFDSHPGRPAVRPLILCEKIDTVKDIELPSTMRWAFPSQNSRRL